MSNLKISVDFDRCESHGECALAAPEVFALDEQGFLQVGEEVDETLRPQVERAVRACPTQAISLDA